MQLAGLAIILLWTLSLGPALAQQPDPRLAGPMIQALQAQVAFQQALMKVQTEDAEAQKAQLWDWFLAAQVEAEKKRAEARQ